MKPVVSMKNICKHFSTKQIEVAVLQDISLEINEGEFVAISGPSGCGKSTLLSIMGLMDSASSGEYLLSDIATSTLKVNQKTKIRNLHIGFVFQSFNLIDNMSVYDNIALPLAHRGLTSKDIKPRVEDVLNKVDMQLKRNSRPNQLSGGQQQRIAIARALVGNPDLILVDEPTGNLDSKNGDQVINLLQQLNASGSTIVMVTHDLRYAQCATRQIQLFDGKILSIQSDKNRLGELA